MKATRFVLSFIGALAALGMLRAESGKASAPEKKILRVLPGPAPGEVRPGTRFERVLVNPGPVEKETVTFLGVETAPVPPALTAQLGLPSESGLVVHQVLPDSPAAAALQEHDVLLKLDDQLLVDQRQLSILVRNRKEGDEVALTYVRGGKQAAARVKLARREQPKLMAYAFDRALPVAGAFQVAGTGPFGVASPLESRVEVDRVLSMIQRGPGGPEVVTGTIAPDHIQIDARPGPRFGAQGVNLNNSTLLYTDENGSLDLVFKDGRKTLTAKNPKGEEVFSGPVTTPEERKAMPAEVRERLERLEGMQDVMFRTDGDFKGAETKVIRELRRGAALPARRPPGAALLM